MRKAGHSLILSLILCFCFPCGIRGAFADEPVERFLNALKENGYYDVALEYLESVDRRNLIDEDFRRVLAFEKAEILIASVSTLRDAKLRDARLNEAQQILARFNSAGATLEQLARVANYQGNLFLNRARLTLAMGGSDRLTAGEKEKFAAQSRQFLQNARENYLEAKRHIRELIDPHSPQALKVDPQDPASTDRLSYFQNLYVNVRFNLATSIEQLADTYSPADPEYVAYLNEAATEYKNHHEDYYAKYLAAWNARLGEARCYQKLNKHGEALKLLEEIFQKEGGAFANLKNLAYQLACDSWNQLDLYPANEIAQRLEPVVEGLNRAEAQSANWLRVQLELAIALFRQSEETGAQPGARARNEAEALRRKGSKHLRQVAKFASPHRERARELMVQWKVSMSEPKMPDESAAPTSFEDARQKIKEEVAEIENLMTELRIQRTDLAKAAASERPAMEESMDGLSAQLLELADQVLQDIARAMELADEDTQIADVNQLRYFQSFAFFASERWIEAALIGEFMLQKFPAIEMTRQATNFVIPSYNRLYNLAPENERNFERNRLIQVCSRVIERWPGSDEAARAAASWIALSLAAKDFDQTDLLFKNIPENFPGLAQLSAQFGIKLWVDYRERIARWPDDKETLASQRLKAKTYLEQALKLASSESVSPDLAVASRLLVDIYLDLGDLDQALQTLELTDLAPLDLVKQKHPVIAVGPLSETYTRETYRLALRVYLAQLKNSTQPQQAIDKMTGILAAMKQHAEVSEKAEDRRQLSQIYSLIANEILNQFDAKAPQEKVSFARSLMNFLSSIERDSTDAETILWAGATALKVANSLTELNLAEESKPMFQQAVSALNRAEELGFEDTPQRENLLLELKRQRGLALRGSQNYEEAIQQFLEILDHAPQNVKVQIDAASTLQVWGVATQGTRRLEEAIKGSNKKLNPQTKREANQIWGWEFLARATRGKNDDLFCQAIFHWAECLLEHGLLEKNPNRIATALRLIETEESRPPGLNDASWKPKLESLKQRIKQNQ
jgi:cellulose synthase operon protein C